MSVNTGHRDDGKASCCVGQGANITFKDFRTFCAKAIAGIGRNLPDTVMDRSIPIYLKRQAPEERVARFRRRDVKPEADELRGRVSEWVLSILGELREARPSLPEQLSDRRQDGLEPLLAIAEAAGGEWPQRIRSAALEVFTSSTADDASLGVQLLADIRTIFDDHTDDKITSEELIAKLQDVESSPWADWDHGKGLSKGKLARMLRKYDVAPRTIRLEAQIAKGYLRDSFADAWRRYLTLSGVYTAAETVTALQPQSLQAETHFCQTLQEPTVTVSKSASDPHKHCSVTDVTFSKPDLKSGGEQHEGSQSEHSGFDVGAMALAELRIKAGLRVAPHIMAEYQRWIAYLDSRKDGRSGRLLQ